MDKWEYRTDSQYLSSWEMNKLGDQGWELVGFTATRSGGMFPLTEFRYVFKRKKP